MQVRKLPFLAYLCLVLVCGIPGLLFSRDGVKVENWIKPLSVKRDIHGANVQSILLTLILLDSTERCSLLAELEKRGPKDNKRFQIRLSYLYGLVVANKIPCITIEAAQEKMHEALRMAYEIEDPWLIEEAHEVISRVYFSTGENGLAIVHALIAIELQETLGIEDFLRGASLRYEVGYLLYHAKEYRTAIRMSYAAIQKTAPKEAPADTLNVFYKMNAWNTIGLSHMKLHEYDSAFIAYHQADHLAGKLSEAWLSDFWKGVIKGNRGDIYYQTGQIDSARALLQFDYHHSLTNNQYDNAANSLQWLARIHVMDGSPALALKELREASFLEQRLPKPEYRANILYAYAEVFKSLRNPDSLDYYLKKYIVLHDSLEHAAFESKANIVQMRLENQKSVNQVRELNKEKKNILLIRNFIIAIVMLGAVTGYLFFHRERLKMHWRQHQAMQDKLKAEAEAELTREQLRTFTAHMLEKTELVDALKAQLVQKEYSHDATPNEAELTQLQILTDEDWEKFRTLFENVYPGFFQTLKRKTEGITLAEQRMASLIKLKVPAKKAAIILGISPNSVYKTRQRLRNRLGLSTDGELDEYFP